MIHDKKNENPPQVLSRTSGSIRIYSVVNLGIKISIQLNFISKFIFSFILINVETELYKNACLLI